MATGHAMIGSQNSSSRPYGNPMETSRLQFFYKEPRLISPDILDALEDLIRKGEGVGTSYVRENLRNAFLIGYALCAGRGVGTVTHKHPKAAYRQKIEAATGLDLSGYLERGYTAVAPEYRDQDIGDILIKGLIKRSRGRKIYVTIRMDNVPALKLTAKNDMALAARFVHEKTRNEIGVFTNHKALCARFQRLHKKPLEQ
jgi:GNAT superfamily N-acetyltransferase